MYRYKEKTKHMNIHSIFSIIIPQNIIDPPQ